MYIHRYIGCKAVKLLGCGYTKVGMRGAGGLVDLDENGFWLKLFRTERN